MPDTDRMTKFRITYSKTNDHKTIYADGALVGQPAGDSILMDFYVGNFTPVNEFYTWSDEKKIFDVTYESEEVPKYERVRQVEVVMTPANAELLATGILERVKALKGKK